MSLHGDFGQAISQNSLDLPASDEVAVAHAQITD